MRQTKNILNYGPGSIPWVDRRTGGPNHSPMWSLGARRKAKAKKDSTAQAPSEGTRILLWLQACGLALYVTNTLWESLTWGTFGAWMGLTLIIAMFFFIPIIKHLAYLAMSCLYAFGAYKLFTYDGVGWDNWVMWIAVAIIWLITNGMQRLSAGD